MREVLKLNETWADMRFDHETGKCVLLDLWKTYEAAEFDMHLHRSTDPEREHSSYLIMEAVYITPPKGTTNE